MASFPHQFWGKMPTFKWGLTNPGVITAGYSCFSYPKSPMPEDMRIPCFSNSFFLSLSGISCRMRIIANLFFDNRQVSSGSWKLFLTIPWLILLGHLSCHFSFPGLFPWKKLGVNASKEDLLIFFLIHFNVRDVANAWVRRMGVMTAWYMWENWDFCGRIGSFSRRIGDFGKHAPPCRGHSCLSHLLSPPFSGYWWPNFVFMWKKADLE